MSFSVRVHPAPFSPTPNRHAGIGLKMKSVGPGGSRFELVGLLDPQRKERKRCRSPKRGRRPGAPPPPGAGIGSGVAVGWWEKKGVGIPRGEFPHSGVPWSPPSPLLCFSRWRLLKFLLVVVLHSSQPGGGSKPTSTAGGVSAAALPTSVSLIWSASS